MSDTDAVRRLLLAVERLEASADTQAQQAREVARGLQQAHAAKLGLGSAREAEEAKLKQALVRLFQEQQHRMETALRPVTGRAWRGLIAVATGFALLYLGFFLLLGHEYGRLKDARERADAAEVSAEIRQASRHVEITSCGGRPCIRIDRHTPTWKGREGEYVLVDGATEQPR